MPVFTCLHPKVCDIFDLRFPSGFFQSLIPKCNLGVAVIKIIDCGVPGEVGEAFDNPRRGSAAYGVPALA